MAHVTSKSYQALQKRLDEAPQGAPASESLFKILEVLFTEEEAGKVSLLPVNLFTIEEASKLWKKPNDEARTILDTLADKGILFDFTIGETQAYVLAPPMAGFFEFSLMRLDGRFDKRLLSELYYQYINIEEDLIQRIFSLDPAIHRAFIQEDTIQDEDKVEVLNYERASHVINTATCITVGICYCRHKIAHLGKGCSNPQDVCLTFNKTAESLAKHKIAREIDKREAQRILEECRKAGLVQLGDNVQNMVNWICNCCSCCCEALLAYRRLGYNAKINTNFISRYSREECTGCEICVARCSVDAITICSNQDGNYYPEVNAERCIGCGICARFCPTDTLSMERRKEMAFVPVDSFERFVLNAIDTGTLQNVLWNNSTLLTHDILRRFLRILLSLKPAKRLLAKRQLRSRFLTLLTKTEHYTLYDKLVNDGRGQDYSHPELAF